MTSPEPSDLLMFVGCLPGLIMSYLTMPNVRPGSCHHDVMHVTLKTIVCSPLA